MFILRQLIEKAVEWRAPHLFVMDGDIKKPCDHASHSLFAEAARSRGMHEVLLQAWLREWRNMKSVFKLDSQTTSAEVERTRSFPQGDPAAPMIFNLVLDTIAETFIKTALQKGWGKKLQDGSWVNLIMFADNYWLVATSPRMLTLMTGEWLRLLGGVGWETPTADLTWCTTADDDLNMEIYVDGELIRRPKRGVGFKVLGTLVTFVNNFDVEIENRLARAAATFHANWELLGCTSCPLAKRMQIFRATVESTFLWCAGSWNLRAEQLKRIKGAQSRLLRTMLRIERLDGEDMQDLIIRANHILKQRLHTTYIKHAWWDEMYVQLRLDWGGHVARLRELDPSRLTYRVFTHWNYNAIRHVSDQHEGRQHHGRHLHIWRWEYYLYQHLGNTWFNEAQNRDTWKTCVNKAKELIICKFGPR